MQSSARAAEPKMQVSTRRVGPQEAETYLRTQARNRRLRQTHLQWLAGAMRRGEWEQNGEAIKFDWNGQLRDGQHRLQAIVESGVVLELLVVEGLRPEAQETMDTGARRNMSDVLALRGERNTAMLAATLGVLWRIQEDVLRKLDSGGGAVRSTPKELLKLLEQEPEIRNFLQQGRAVSERVQIPASLAAAFWYVFNRIDAEDADKFFHSLKSGEDLSEGDPIFALRRFLERERQSSRILPRYRTAGMIVKAWNSWRRGETVRAISFRAGGANAEDFPGIDGSEPSPMGRSASRRATGKSKRRPRSVRQAPKTPALQTSASRDQREEATQSPHPQHIHQADGDEAKRTRKPSPGTAAQVPDAQPETLSLLVS
jgi:hypothetical protein